MVATESEVSYSIRSLNARANALLMHSRGLTNTAPARQAFRRQVPKSSLILKANCSRTFEPAVLSRPGRPTSCGWPSRSSESPCGEGREVVTAPPESGGGRGPTPRPSAHYYNQPETHGTSGRLLTEVVPRLDAILSIESAALLGLGLFTLEDIAPSVVRLAETARQQVLIAEQERQLRGAA